MKHILLILFLVPALSFGQGVKVKTLNLRSSSSSALDQAARDSALLAIQLARSSRDSANKSLAVWKTSDGSNKVWVATPTGRQAVDLVRTAVGTVTNTCQTIDFSSVTSGTTYTTNQCYRVIDAEGEYGDLVYKTVRINISTASGLQISTQLANTENIYDYLKVYATSDLVTPIATLTGSNTITLDADNDITLEWNSDNGNGGQTYNGFEITVIPL